MKLFPPTDPADHQRKVLQDLLELTAVMLELEQYLSPKGIDLFQKRKGEQNAVPTRIASS